MLKHLIAYCWTTISSNAYEFSV